MAYTDFLQLVQARQSDRSYDKERPVEPEKLERVLEAARLAPSACNAQPWRFVVITDKELAQKAGINGKNLVETVKKWNKFCKKGTGDEMGRPTCMDDHRLDEGGPYYATLMTPSVHHTMGGVQINEKAQVINNSGKVIPGLYAAGEITGGIHGTNRVGCNAVPDALTFGRIAGLAAAGK